MCGRYALDVCAMEIASAFQVGLGSAGPWSASWNIAPTRLVPVIRLRDGQAKVDLLRWGLVPEWSSDPEGGVGLINARAETIDVRPSFRHSYAHARCVVPVRAFYEWQGEGRRRRPLAIRASDDGLVALAGIWACWKEEDGGRLETFAIVTKAAGPFLEPIHHRMPVMLNGQDRDRWLDHRGAEDGGPKPAECRSILNRAGDGGLRVHPVSNRVGSPANDDSHLLDEQLPGATDHPTDQPGLFEPVDD